MNKDFKPLIYFNLLLCLWFCEPMARANSTFSGDVTLKAQTFLQTLAPNTNDQLYQGTLHLADESELNENLKFVGRIEYTADPANKSTIEQNYLDLPEFNLKWRAQPLLVKLGNDIYSWGVTDGVNPVDLINLRQYFDPIHSKKMGAGGLLINSAFGHFEVDAVYIPQARSPMLPGSNSRWLPRQVYYSASPGQSDTYLLPNEFLYTFVNMPDLNSARKNNVALRLQAHLPDLELALYGYNGNAPLPIITPVIHGNTIQFPPNSIIQVDANVLLQLQNYRQQTGGVSFVKTLASWQIKGEAAWTQPLGDAVSAKSWLDTTVFAIEKNWNVGEEATLITVLQYAYSKQPGDISNSVDSLAHVFDSNWMLGGHFTWRDNDTVTFFFSEDVLNQAWLADLRYERTLRDDLTLGVATSLLGGPTDSSIGVFSKNKNIDLDIKYNF